MILFSTDHELTAELIFKYYAARFQIKFPFRDAKLFARLTDCQTHDKTALGFHVNTASAAVDIAKIK